MNVRYQKYWSSMYTYKVHHRTSTFVEDIIMTCLVWSYILWLYNVNITIITNTHIITLICHYILNKINIFYDEFDNTHKSYIKEAPVTTPNQKFKPSVITGNNPNTCLYYHLTPHTHKWKKVLFALSNNKITKPCVLPSKPKKYTLDPPPLITVGPIYSKKEMQAYC